MAIKRTSSNSISNAVKLSTGFASAAIPNSPTIGTATATSDVAATVTYTAAVLGATGSTFTATSNPSSITGTGSSPITVTGLTASTSYTFSVTAGNANGTSAASSASNSITTSAPLSSYESIATVTVSSATPTITFSSIPATFEHLQLRIFAATDRPTYALDNILLTFNGDSAANYSNHFIFGDGAITASAGNANISNVRPGTLPSSAAPNIFGVSVFDVLDYKNTNKYKTFRSLSGFDLNGAIAGYGGYVQLNSGNWRNTSAITSITLNRQSGDNFTQYSQFALYGIKGS